MACTVVGIDNATTLPANCNERVKACGCGRPRNEDADGLVETQTDDRVRRYLGGAPPEQDVRGLIDSVGAAPLLSPAGCYVVAEKESDEMFGTIVLNWRGRSCPVACRTPATSSS